MTDHRPLAGIRILDFSWAIVGNVAAKILGDFGAEVWKIETGTRLAAERLRRHVAAESDSHDDRIWFAHLSTSKQSVAVNLRSEEGKEIVRNLARHADVVLENFSPGTIDRMGFGYEALRAIKPDLVMASGSIFGQSGPLGSLPGTDATGAARSGRMGASGYVDGPPLLPGVTYGDSVVPYYLVSAIVAALRHRDATGQGCRIDAAMVELLAQQMARAILAPGEVPARLGNREPDAAPHGVFPVAGEDRWIAIECWTDEEWRRLCTVLKIDAGDPRFARHADRKANEDALEAMIGASTATRDGTALMEALQGAGLAAGMVQSAADIVDGDPQLAARGFLTPVAHHMREAFPHQRTPISLSRTPGAMSPAPRLGGNTRDVLSRVLGMNEEAISALEVRGILA